MILQIDQPLHFTGDVHGGLPSLAYYLEISGYSGCAVAVLGDIGCGFGGTEEMIRSADRRLSKSGNVLYCLRGNHDDPAYFDGYRTHPELEKYGGVRLLPDFAGVTARDGSGAEHRALVVGGGISVDRSSRIKGKSWWEDEDVRLPEELPEMKFDMIWSHEAPGHGYPFFDESDLPPIFSGYLPGDPGLARDCKASRRKLDKIMALAEDKGSEIRLWMYGHYHARWDRKIRFADGSSARLIGMDMLRAGRRHSADIISLDYALDF